MKIDVDTILDALTTAHAAYQAVEDVAEGISVVLTSNDQARLKAWIERLRADNDTARVRRHRLLVEAGARS